MEGRLLQSIFLSVAISISIYEYALCKTLFAIYSARAPVLSSEPAIQEVQHTGDIPGHRIAAPLRIERSAVIH